MERRTLRVSRGWRAAVGGGWVVLATLAACEAGGEPRVAGGAAPALSPREAQRTDTSFAGLVRRLSEAGGFFDTDNLISNESGYLKVMGALDRLAVRGGAYVGVGPDQNFSYIARIRPEVAFLVDIRRDNLLHHLLLKALMEASPTRVEFLSALHGKEPPPDPAEWVERPVEAVVAWVDEAPTSPAFREALQASVEDAVRGFGVPLDEADLATVGRFHRTFMDAGLDLRFTSFGRPPRPYYPTYRRLVLETDMDGANASYLAREEDYAFLRGLQRAGKIVPVVGDLAGDHALREVGAVLRESGLSISAIYASNVEFYLWGDGSFPDWTANVASLPASPNAVVIRSYFPNFGGVHPSAVPGHYATQTLQPVATLVAGEFATYWDVVTREAVPLR